MASRSDHGRIIYRPPTTSASQLSRSVEKATKAMGEAAYSQTKEEKNRSYAKLVDDNAKASQISLKKSNRRTETGNGLSSLRIVFPNGYTMVGLFIAPTHKIKDVDRWVQETLYDWRSQFTLITTFPVTRLTNKEMTLKEAKLYPSSVLYFSSDSCSATATGQKQPISLSADFASRARPHPSDTTLPSSNKSSSKKDATAQKPDPHQGEMPSSAEASKKTEKKQSGGKFFEKMRNKMKGWGYNEGQTAS